MDHTVDILLTEHVTHDVRRFVTTRPEGLEFTPGQGVELALDRDDWREEGRPFTPTSVPSQPVLEFTIKEYPDHDGVTTRLHDLESGDRLLLSEPFGTIEWKGPGVFLAGGAGLTPFLAILRQRHRDGGLAESSLIFSNKTRADVIGEPELRHAFGDRCEFLLTREDAPGYGTGRIDRDLLAERFGDRADETRFYVCGPPAFVEDINGHLEALGASSDELVFEG